MADTPHTFRSGPSDPIAFADGPGTYAEIRIAAEPSRVWALVTDIELPAGYSEEFRGAEWVGSVGPALGASFIGRNENEFLGSWDIECHVDRFEVERVFGWCTDDVAEPGPRWWFTLTPCDGGTDLRFDLTLGPGRSGLTMAIESMPEKEPRIIGRRLRDLHENMRRTVEGIRDLAEQPSTMTAAITTGHGGIERIELRDRWPCPAPRSGEALVRVTAAALNNTDIWSREGTYGTAENPDAVVGWRGVPLEFPRIQGMDIAGVVAAVGDGVDHGWIGRRVIVDPAIEYTDGLPSWITGSEQDGGFAEYHSCSQRQLHDVTDSPLDDAQLACIPTAYGTALGMINRAACSERERVLVTGASGGVGMAAVQLLTQRGCEVSARTSAQHHDLVAAQGVSEVSLRGVDDLSQLAEVDAVVDVVGGEEFGLLVDRLRSGGRLVTAGAVAGPVVRFDIRRLYLRQRTMIGSTMHTKEDFAELARIARAGTVQPVVAARYALTDIAQAQRHFMARDFVGKIILEP